KNARAVVVPSLWHENFPYVILQSFAAAKPVLGSNRGGIPELINSGPHGWVYEAHDVGALAQSLTTISNLPNSSIQEMGMAAQKYVCEEFTDEAIYNRLISIYKKVQL